ncbi:MAG: hypothetical protein WCV00_02405 [Verrucomicrobiia bacterium]|jgi:hypothetical protein
MSDLSTSPEVQGKAAGPKQAADSIASFAGENPKPSQRSAEFEPFHPNSGKLLGDNSRALAAKAWPKQNTAVLVIHGIGNQNPLETLDSFARELLKTLDPDSNRGIELEHRLEPRHDEEAGGRWFDSFLRLTCAKEETHLDIYEYYWANLSENKATVEDIRRWVRNAATAGKKFYRENAALAKTCEPDGVFTKSGRFLADRYYFMVHGISMLATTLSTIVNAIRWLVAKIPFFGESLAGGLGEWKSQPSNILGDITVYTTTDAKSAFYEVRKAILGGAVSAIRHLIEPCTPPAAAPAWSYDRVVIAAHSLGTQIAVDALNRINLLVSQGDLAGFTPNGQCKVPNGKFHNVAELLCGLVTFGCPADKIAFFLREHATADAYIRREMLQNFHGFRQRRWSLGLPTPRTVHSSLQRVFDNIRWWNYHDLHDYVSGSIDYYEGVVNWNCCYPAKWYGFTHSNYWGDRRLYADIIQHFLTPVSPPHR